MIKERKKFTHNQAEILLVEDSHTQAEQIMHLLQSHYYNVSVAQNGKQAMDWLSMHKPTLVISDIVMPEMNGFELCKKIKFNKSTEDIPVILLTRLVDPEEIVEGLTCGADSFITKPYNEKHLLSNIEKILYEKKTKEHKKVPFGVQILFKGKKRYIQAEQQNVIKLMLDIYEGAIHQNESLLQTQEELRLLNERLESLVEDRTADLSEEIKLSKQIANSLKESEERYKRLVDLLPDSMVVHSEGKIVFANKATLELIGAKSLDEIIGKSALDFVHPDYKDIAIQRIKRIYENKEKGELIDEKFIKLNGDVIDVEVTAIPISYFGKPSVQMVFRDITDRRRNEEMLVRLKKAVETSGEAIFITDREGIFRYLNPAFTVLYGYTSEDIEGKATPRVLKSGHMEPQNIEMFWKTLLEGQEVRGEIINKRKDGMLLNIESSATSILDEMNNIIGFLGIQHDITKRKTDEAELIKAKDKAEESDRLKTAFLHNISHEIRTPMNAIVGFSSLLGEPDVDAQSRKDYIEVIMQSSNHLLAIISDIVDISNIEANLVKIVKKEINLNSTLKSLYEQFLPKTGEKRIQLICESDVPDSDAFIVTDSTKLNQILINLIDNAIKFTDKGYVKVAYVVKDKFLEFRVSDTGIGIPEEFHQKIFDRFYQVQHTISRLYEGTGLGLAISKANVELMGGKIRLSSEPGAGTSFYFTIPYEKQSIVPLPVIEKPADKGFIFTEKKTILVAEDIDSNFQLVRYFLSGTNFDIVRAVNGKMAVEKCLSNKDIDLILMDIKMPVLDGYTAVKLIRETNTTIPIIAQTAYADDKTHAIECGCTGFISKPFDKKSLLKVIHEFI